MPINRHVVREEVATYASVLLDGAYEAGGQSTVLEVRDQLESILRALRERYAISPLSNLMPLGLQPLGRSSRLNASMALGTPDFNAL